SSIRRRSSRSRRRCARLRELNGYRASAIRMSARSPLCRSRRQKRTEAAAPPPQSRLSAAGVCDRAEQPVLFAVDPGGEVDGVRVTAEGRATTVANTESPQAVDRDGITGRHVTELAPEIPFVQGIGVDVPVTKVSDQQVTGQPSETCRRDRQAPGRVEPAMRDKSSQQMAVHVEGVDEAMAA